MFDHIRSGHPDRKNRGGFSVAELLITVSLFGLLVTVGFSGFKSFQHHTRTNNAIRTVTSAFNTARYRAIEHNKSIRVSLENNRLVLKLKKGEEWLPYLDFQLPPGQAATMNASPVFFPTGYASPLCTVTIKNSRDEHRITISIAGRIKVTKL
jgi:Tfp pilus assembly protein PilE